ncbi:hypothetical protein GCM10023144_17300 [Pigmentiphaga soli]|uniref:Zinc finger/thioredoxin putative domain-containing protein n=1 Tax=Pigmentiphaga soli TaxID=1007095 RepID=A0ABP8GU89_9BURK
MTLATRCPHCGTAFRIVADQIRVRDGLVRCGVCNAIFDGRATLISVEDGAALAPQAGMPAAAHDRLPDTAPAGPGTDAAPEPAVLRKRGQGFQMPAGTEYGAAADGGPFAASASAQAAVPADAASAADSFTAAGAFTAAGMASSAPGAPPAFLDDGAREQRRSRAAWWAVAALLALVALALQAIWVFRSELAVRAPALRPALERLCGSLGCTVDYPRDITLLSIESSSLEPLAAAQGGEPAGADSGTGPAADAAGRTGADSPAGTGASPRRLTLQVVLRNRGRFPQPWPAIELSLTDFSGAVVARKVLPPSAYLPPDLRAVPLQAGQERTLDIPVESAAAATGYRVDIFFP